jgi:hypothetical protein
MVEAYFWQLCSRYKVSLTLSRKYITPLLREDDRSFMDVVCSTNMYTHDYQLAGQRVRRYKGLFSIGDFVLMDGWTIDPFVLTREPSDSCRVFSVEKPTRADFCKFREMVQNFSSEYFILPIPLGKFISAPHRSDVWFTNNDQSEVYNILDNTSYVLYSKSIHHRTTRHGTRFTNP